MVVKSATQSYSIHVSCTYLHLWKRPAQQIWHHSLSRRPPHLILSFSWASVVSTSGHDRSTLTCWQGICTSGTCYYDAVMIMTTQSWSWPCSHDHDHAVMINNPCYTYVHTYIYIVMRCNEFILSVVYIWLLVSLCKEHVGIVRFLFSACSVTFGAPWNAQGWLSMFRQHAQWFVTFCAKLICYSLVIQCRNRESSTQHCFCSLAEG